LAGRNRKKKQRNPLIRFTIIVFLIILIGYLIFYSIDNPGFLKSFFNFGDNGSERAGPGAVSESVEEEALPVETEEAAAYQGPSLWQRILAFFHNKFNPPEEIESYPSRMTINIYFVGTGEEKMLAAEERSIVAGNPGNALKGAVEELLKGPLRSYHFPVIPAGTSLLGSRFADGVAEIDLSREFLDNALDTRILDEYIIYSIVNTVTEIPDIGGVIFFIEGKRIKTYGNIDLSIPLIRNTDLLEKEE
jgi:hypothetical protein